MIFSKRITLVFSLMVIASSVFANAQITPEMVAHMKYANSLMDLKEGLDSGKINSDALLEVASDLKLKLIAAEEAKNLTLLRGSFSCFPTLSALEFKLGTETCGGTVYIFGFGGTAEVKTKNLIIAAVVAIALGVAYKKGYLGKIKNYFMKSDKKDEDESSAAN